MSRKTALLSDAIRATYELSEKALAPRVRKKVRKALKEERDAERKGEDDDGSDEEDERIRVALHRAVTRAL